MTEAEVARLYTEYGYVLFRRCLAYLGDEAAAQDAVQEVFAGALGTAEGLRGEADPRTWLCRISDHLCVDLLRRRRRNPVHAQAAAGEPPENELGAAQLAAAIVDDARESFSTVRRLLADLDTDMQRLAVLYYLDELTQEELARELGLSRRTVGKRLQRLLARVRTLLDQEKSA